MTTLEALASRVDVYSIDEAFLDLTGIDRVVSFEPFGRQAIWLKVESPDGYHDSPPYGDDESELRHLSKIWGPLHKVGRRADLRTTSDVLRANQNLHSARFELTASRYNHLYNRLKLAYVAGELKENDLQEINEMLMPRAVAESARQVEPALQKAIIGLHGISLTRNRLIDLQQD
jgi:nucleotidyltransferase/DNA polymerase involved in DNA repair